MNIKKIIIWTISTIIIYLLVFNIIIYLDPTNTNIRGLKSLSLFTTMMISYFIGSYLAR